MPKPGNNKRQKTILNYFSSQSKQKEEKCPTDSLVTDSLEAMTLDTHPPSEVHDKPNESESTQSIVEKSDLPTHIETDNIIQATKEESIDNNNNNNNDEEEEEEIVVSKSKRRRKLKRVIEEETSTSSDDDSEANIPISVRLTKLKQKHQEKHQNLTFMKHNNQGITKKGQLYVIVYIKIEST